MAVFLSDPFTNPGSLGHAAFARVGVGIGNEVESKDPKSVFSAMR
jgi:hypothetical protein